MTFSFFFVFFIPIYCYRCCTRAIIIFLRVKFGFVSFSTIIIKTPRAAADRRLVESLKTFFFFYNRIDCVLYICRDKKKKKKRKELLDGNGIIIF